MPRDIAPGAFVMSGLSGIALIGRDRRSPLDGSKGHRATGNGLYGGITGLPMALASTGSRLEP